MGIFFGRKRTTVKDAPGTEAVPADTPHFQEGSDLGLPETRVLSPLSPLDDDDPRVIARMILTELSYSVTFHSDDPIEILWPKLLAAAPRLRHIQPRAAWIAQPTWSESVYIVGIDSPAGSAAIIGCAPGCDVAVLTEDVFTKLRPNEDSGWELAVVAGERVSHKVAWADPVS